MTDNLTIEQRKACMRAVCGKNTTPEMRVRRLVHGSGYRYSLHSRTLPGKPDLTFRSRHRVIFVHGCFWHSHRCRHGQKAPVTNFGYWNDKRQRTAARDKEQVAALRADGWKVLVVWECWTRSPTLLAKKVLDFLREET
jgi:DNA mismatch endonuclease (patch repair protein)